MTANEDRWLDVLDVRCEGRHGVHPEERATVREFVIDVSVRGAVRADGAAIAGLASGVVAGRSRHLLERLAADVAAAILDAHGEATAVRVRVTKPDPPGLDAAAEAVTLTLSRTTRGEPAPSARRAPQRGRRARG